jgi:hypothetical protein
MGRATDRDEKRKDFKAWKVREKEVYIETVHKVHILTVLHLASK